MSDPGEDSQATDPTSKEDGNMSTTTTEPTTADKVKQALATSDGALTIAELAERTGAKQATVERTVGKLAKEGELTKAGVSGRSATWALTSTTPDVTLDVQAEPEVTSNDTADGNWSEAEDARYAQTQEDENVTTSTETEAAETTDKPVEKAPRERAPRIGTLGVRHERGSVSDAIVAWLEDQGGEAYTPHNIAKALGDRTSGTGATAYSCDKLALAGRIAQVPGKPIKYQALTAEQREAYEQAQRESAEAASERLATEAQAREAKQAEREAAKAAKVAAKEQAKADKRAARAAKQAEKEAEKAAKAQARADAKAAKEAEKAAAQAEATEDVTE